MSISEELGRAIQYYCDNHERMGDAWLVCKLNDIVYDCKEAEERIKELEEALRTLLASVDDYIEYEHDGDPFSEDARVMGEMELNEINNSGELSKIKQLLKGEEQ